MMAILPGIDANDINKTAAVFRFYTAILINIPTFDTSSSLNNNNSNNIDSYYELPLDVESWAEELGSRLFVLMENLEGPDLRTDQSHTTEKTSSKGTFLMHV